MKVSRVHRNFCFTLIEVLMAVALTAILLAGGYEVIISATNISRSQQQAATASRTGWQTLQQMSRELRASMPRADTGDGSSLTLKNADFSIGARPADTEMSEYLSAFPDQRAPADLDRKSVV